jgi:triosephosphate isomerase
MNKTPEEAASFMEKIAKYQEEMNPNCDIAICAPFICLDICVEKSKQGRIKIGAQNCHFEKSGAFTGEISAYMLSKIGVKFTILGHSERRQYFAETSETVNLKVKSSLKSGLDVIICVGESLEQKSTAQKIIFTQLELALLGVDIADLPRICIAYEPIWAIGSNKIEWFKRSGEICMKIRSMLGEIYDSPAAASLVKILYGGSVNSSNLISVLSEPDIDGALVGNASLVSDEFLKIIECARGVKRS